MCRSIRTLYNYEPPATDQEIRAAALQFVRKVSGMRKPSAANAEAFEAAVADIEARTLSLLAELTTTQPPKDREVEAEKSREKFRKRQAREREKLLASEI